MPCLHHHPPMPLSEPAVTMATGPGSGGVFPVNIIVVDSRGEVGRLILGTDPALGN